MFAPRPTGWTGVGYGCGWERSENADFTENKTLHNTAFQMKVKKNGLL